MNLSASLPRALALALPLFVVMSADGHGRSRAAAAPAPDDTVVAWRLVGRAPNASLRRDTVERHGGSASGLLRASTPMPDIVNSGGRGGTRQAPRMRPVSLEQTLNALPYRERRVRVSFWVRTRLPEKPAKGMPVPQAHGFIRVDNEDGTFSHYDGSMSPIYGSTEWTRKFMVIEVPPDAFALSFGVSVLGPGEVWLDDALIEDQAPASGAYQKQPMLPPARLQQMTPEQVAQGKEMLARRVTAMKERPAELVNGDFESR